MRLESIYTRATGISGEPLNDSYHFGQTIINDYGRPFGEGFNNVTGFSGWATEGRYTIYVRGEYQTRALVAGVLVAGAQRHRRHVMPTPCNRPLLSRQ